MKLLLLSACLSACVVVDTGSPGLIYDCEAIYSCPDFAWTWRSNGSVCAANSIDASELTYVTAPVPPFDCLSGWRFVAACDLRIPSEYCRI